MRSTKVWLAAGLVALAGCGTEGTDGPPDSKVFHGAVTMAYEYERFGTLPFELCPTLGQCKCLPAPFNLPIAYFDAGVGSSAETPTAVTFTTNVVADVGTASVEWRNTTTGRSWHGHSVTIPITEVHGNWDYVFSQELGETFIPACTYGDAVPQPASVVFPLRDYGDAQYEPFLDSIILWLTNDANGVRQVFPLCDGLSTCQTHVLSYDMDHDYTCKLVALVRAANPPVQVKWEREGGPTLYGNEVTRPNCVNFLGKWTVTFTDALGNTVIARSAFQNLRDEGVSFQIPD